ncbi:MAG: hypothetical protein K9N07_00820 [Candidatus Cloacimonetes bacterium]|nr:hypothetical protein [Candidatus Cloacimonadota bacterium]
MKKGKLGYLIIASAIIWGAVLIGCAAILKGTQYKGDINLIIIGGIIFHFLFIWAPLGNQLLKKG